MSNDPDQIRAQIERTRSSLSENVNTLTDTVTPSHIARRQADKARHRLSSLTGRVMGTASELSSTTSNAASNVGSAVSSAPDTVKAQAAGNPLAAGLVAFGVGWLAGSLMPASRAESRAAGQLKDTAAPMVVDAAKEVAEHLKEPAQQAVASVQQSATDAASTVKDESVTSAQDVKDQAMQAKDTVQQARS
jgi:ElaB/YqjD/DUF883 family membrane-anchored ribosome-binding protein